MGNSADRSGPGTRRPDGRRLRTSPAVLAALAAMLGCSSGLSLAGDQDADDGATADGAAEAGLDVDAGDDGSGLPDGGADGDGDPDAAADADGEVDADAGADATDVPPDGAVVHLVPDDEVTYFDVGGWPSPWREVVAPMHRHSFPLAWSGAAYAVVLEDRTATEGLPGPIAVYRFEPGVDGLEPVWVDDAPETTEYNSICWTGAAFVAAFPTTGVGLRIVALSPAGDLLREPQLLEPLAEYVAAEHGEAPVVLCPGSGAFVLEPGRGTGGRDRLHALASNGAYAGAFIDADVPTVARNLYFAPVPCAAAGDDAACATADGLFFLRRDGTVRFADPLTGTPVCGGPSGCDATLAGSEVALLGSASAMFPEVDFLLARYAAGGRLLLPAVALDGPAVLGPGAPRARLAGSGSTVLFAVFGESFGPEPTNAWLVGLDGAPLDSLADVAGCSSPEGCWDRPYQDGGAVVWEGDAYAVLWSTSAGVGLRRLAVAW